MYGLRAQVVAEQLEVLAGKPEDLSLIPKTHMVEELTPRCCPLTCVHTHRTSCRERDKTNLRIYCVRAAIMDH